MKVMFIYAEGCAHCQAAKPVFQELKDAHDDLIEFEAAEISTVQPLYEKHAPRNDDGTPKYIIPTFYVFDEDEATPEDPSGFVGGFEGGNPDEIRAVVSALADHAQARWEEKNVVYQPKR